ncbi:MAG: RNase J family beta-CASP ribonuclease [Xanthomonadaceae bacterium]|nr:RNase J family beta-CASP ribonuclease [Rhodospirillaceae bacterium]NIA18056.1 RNase J family beta-CASP ribonuclease [Xanthomonadaceae bacterium]
MIQNKLNVSSSFKRRIIETANPFPQPPANGANGRKNRSVQHRFKTSRVTPRRIFGNKNQAQIAARQNFAEKIFEKGKLKIIVLGGLEEVGRNMTVIEYENDIMIIDMGLQFPEENMPGIDYIIPNVEYLKNKTANIRGVVITHGHYDHIGAIPHLMPILGNPTIYTGKLTAGFIKKRQDEYPETPKLNFSIIDETSKIQLGKAFSIEFLRVNHSIPDCFAIIVHTPLGTIFHTGDFKIDYSPVNDKPADLNRIAQLGGQGILILMSDSTDATEPGYQISESSIGDKMSKLFEKIRGRIIIGTFASQISRIQKIFDIAQKYGRFICLQGRSMNNNIEIAHQIGYLKFNPKILIEGKDLRRIPDNKILIIGTGAQGESNAFLMRVVNREHRDVRLKKGDTVIFSSSVIPGNERTIQSLKDAIVRQGARIIHYKMMDIHAGGHAKQEDLKLMMRLLKPEYLMPIEANHYMLRMHAMLGEQVGIDRKKIFVADNGQIVEFYKNYQNKVVGVLTNKKVPNEYVMVDGLGVGDIGQIVLRDRQIMSKDGMFTIIVTIDSKTGKILQEPDIISRGFIYMKESKKLIQDARKKIKAIILEKAKEKPINWVYVRNNLRDGIGSFLYQKTKRRPMVLPVIIEM